MKHSQTGFFFFFLVTVWFSSFLVGFGENKIFSRKIKLSKKKKKNKTKLFNTNYHRTVMAMKGKLFGFFLLLKKNKTPKRGKKSEDKDKGPPQMKRLSFIPPWCNIFNNLVSV